MSDDIQTVGQKAYDTLLESFQIGRREGFFKLFAPEVDVILPAPASGHFTGTEGRAKLIEFFSQFTAGAARFDVVELIGMTPVTAMTAPILVPATKGRGGVLVKAVDERIPQQETPVKFEPEKRKYVAR